MRDSTIAIIVVILAVISYASEVIPLTMTTILAVLAMMFTGILKPEEAFAGFGSTVTLMLVGMLIIGDAFFTSGLSDKVGQWFQRHFGHLCEKRFVLALFIIAGALSAFYNGMIVIALFMPIIDSLVVSTNGIITRKGAYMPVGMAAAVGGSLSVIGSSSMMSAVGLLSASQFAYTANFWEPAILGLPGYLAGILMYLTFGKKLQDKCFNFKDIVPDAVSTVEHLKDDKAKRRSMIITLVTLIVCAILFSTNKLNIAAVALMGAAVLILTKSVNEKQAYKNVSWSTIIIVGGSIGFAKGVEVSGAAKVVADFFIEAAGPLGESEFAMCVLVMVLTSILSNFMSNTASVVIVVPIGLTIASYFGCSPTPFVIGSAVGSNLALSTPICTACMTVTTVAGYRFKDFFRVGGTLNILGLIATAIVMKLVYFM